MNLVIDHRERDLKTHFENNENVTFDNLNLGDIQFNYNNDIFLLIERKTIKDFVSSLKDKRYSEQKLRLKNNIEINKILYLLEGNINDYKGEKIDGISKKTITSSIISLLLKDNIKLYQTDNIQGTVDFISRIYKRLKEKPENLVIKNNDNDNINKYSSYIKLVKKENITNDVCYISQLSQIPGISNKIASCIASKYKSMAIICKEYSENPNLLEKFEYEINNGKTRKLGKKKNDTIYNFLFNKFE
jgi:ERCC4-type nuclease